MLAVVRDTETFSSQNAVRASVRPLPQPVLDVLATGRPMAPTLTDSDGQVHRGLRLLVNKAFTPSASPSWKAVSGRTSTLSSTSSPATCRADIIERFAWNLPMFTLTDMLGIPRDDIPTLHRWSVSWLRILQATDGVEELVTRAHDVVAMQRYFVDALQSRVGKAGEDLMSSLLDARVADGEPIGHEEAMRVTINLLIAGHVTRHPQHRQRSHHIAGALGPASGRAERPGPGAGHGGGDPALPSHPRRDFSVPSARTPCSMTWRSRPALT